MQTNNLDLTTVLGRPVRDACVQQLIEFFEEQPELTSRYSGGFYYMQFWQAGFSLFIDEFNVVTTVHVHTKADDEYCAYQYELPLGVSAGLTQAEARALLCPPSKSGGPVQFLQSSPITYWDLWVFGDHSVHFEYPEDRLSVSLVTLAFLPCKSSTGAGNV